MCSFLQYQCVPWIILGFLNPKNINWRHPTNRTLSLLVSTERYVGGNIWEIDGNSNPPCTNVTLWFHQKTTTREAQKWTSTSSCLKLKSPSAWKNWAHLPIIEMIITPKENFEAMGIKLQKRDHCTCHSISSSLQHLKPWSAQNKGSVNDVTIQILRPWRIIVDTSAILRTGAFKGLSIVC